MQSPSKKGNGDCAIKKIEKRPSEIVFLIGISEKGKG
jgi:hypothetical protein